MAIYVDRLTDYNWMWGNGCRLTADSLIELHDFAKRLGLKEKWFQNESIPHYNLSPNKRKIAVAMGAVELSTISERIVHVKQPVRKALKFRPLRRVNGKIVVASYMSWNKLRCADYYGFDLTIMAEYRSMPQDEYVYNHKGELLFFYAYDPNTIPIYDGGGKLSLEEIRELTPEHGLRWSEESVSFKCKGMDSCGTPTFSHFTADYLATHGCDPTEFEPLTVSTVVMWYGWFLLERLSRAKINLPNADTGR